MYDLHNTANLLPLKLRREIALLKIMFSKIQDRQGLQLRELTTRAHDGPIMNVSKPASSRYIKSVAYRGPATWNRLNPELRCLRDKNSILNVIFGKRIELSILAKLASYSHITNKHV